VESLAEAEHHMQSVENKIRFIFSSHLCPSVRLCLPVDWRGNGDHRPPPPLGLPVLFGIGKWWLPHYCTAVAIPREEREEGATIWTHSLTHSSICWFCPLRRVFCSSITSCSFFPIPFIKQTNNSANKHVNKGIHHSYFYPQQRSHMQHTHNGGFTSKPAHPDAHK
jgi:hypothetical protein